MALDLTLTLCHNPGLRIETGSLEEEMMRERPLLRCLAVLMAFVWTLSCVSTTTEKRTQTIKVNTDPPGAKVWVGDESGQKVVGTSPTEVSREYDFEVNEFSSWWWSTVAISALVEIFGIIVLADWLARPQSEGGRDDGWWAGATPMGAGGLGLILGMIFCIKGEREDETESYSIPTTVTIGANLDGYMSQKMDITIQSDQEEINLLLTKAQAPAVAAAPAVEDKPLPGPGPRRQIVAVFDVHDATGRFKKEVMVQLTNYLGTAITSTGLYKTIPREQLRARILEQKKGSYKACVDESCQIALGKVVAAEKSLATQLLRVGNKCAVTANLFDLKTETAEKGAMVNTGCSPDELLDAMKQISEQLAGK